MPVEPGRYLHYKNLPYRVIGTAHHSETMEPLVVYQALYEKGVDGKPNRVFSEQEIASLGAAERLWVRPAAMFAETVSLSGQVVPRFKRIAD